MCGLFGMVRNRDSQYPERASAVLVELGRMSVSRGRDSSGVAFIPSDLSVYSRATNHQVRSKVANLDGVVVVKDTKPFNNFWSDEKYLPLLAGSAVVLGHTRAATQGSRLEMANVSPLAVGALVGTHNGDVDVSGKSFAEARYMRVGGTDTEALYYEIDKTASHRKKIADLLTDVHGRIALAWMDRRYMHRIYLARGGLSPLATAWDVDGNFYWASNPDWFRKIDDKFDGIIQFNDIRIIQEGTLLTVNFDSGIADISDHRQFTPTVRWSDSVMSDSIVWRDFPDADKKVDQSNKRHEVHEPVTTSKYTSKYAWAASSYTSETPTKGTEDSQGTLFLSPTSSVEEVSVTSSDVRDLSSYIDMSAEDAEVEENDLLSEAEYDALIEGLSEPEFTVTMEVIEQLFETWANDIPPIIFGTLQEVLDSDDDERYQQVMKDYNLPSILAARFFIFEVLGSNLFSGVQHQS